MAIIQTISIIITLVVGALIDTGIIKNDTKKRKGFLLVVIVVSGIVAIITGKLDEKEKNKEFTETKRLSDSIHRAERFSDSVQLEEITRRIGNLRRDSAAVKSEIIRRQIPVVDFIPPTSNAVRRTGSGILIDTFIIEIKSQLFNAFQVTGGFGFAVSTDTSVIPEHFYFGEMLTNRALPINQVHFKELYVKKHPNAKFIYFIIAGKFSSESGGTYPYINVCRYEYSSNRNYFADTEIAKQIVKIFMANSDAFNTFVNNNKLGEFVSMYTK